jgi:signal transduction histidine kinase
VSIVLERKAHTIVTIVEDDGCGFNTRQVIESTKDEGNLGLHGMRERVELVNQAYRLWNFFRNRVAWNA